MALKYKEPKFSVGQRFASTCIIGYTIKILMVSPTVDYVHTYTYFCESMWGDNCLMYNTYTTQQIENNFNPIGAEDG